jgi:hypothetical protein
MSTLVTAVLARSVIARPKATTDRPLPAICQAPPGPARGEKTVTSRLLRPVLPQGTRALGVAQR